MWWVGAQTEKAEEEGPPAALPGGGAVFSLALKVPLLYLEALVRALQQPPNPEVVYHGKDLWDALGYFYKLPNTSFALAFTVKMHIFGRRERIYSRCTQLVPVMCTHCFSTVWSKPFGVQEHRKVLSSWPRCDVPEDLADPSSPHPGIAHMDPEA